MTQDEKVAYQREAAALILAQMCTHRGVPRVPEVREGVSAETAAHARQQWESAQNRHRANMAAEAFALAGALVAESELWGGPMDQDGEAIDPRALDRECVHGRKMSEECPECEQRAQAAKEGKPAEAASGEGTDTEG